ncbi:MAG: hypothetical protein NZ845_02350 [Thermodesulfovibrio sp.]|nr:hypothetical protein [Thermodesulfovibrio sp.]MDW7972664.1 hypothetical protein [Thermodesulfovibrio sp.]
MVAHILEVLYTMKDRKVINKNAKVYQRASKKIKSQMITELSYILHINSQSHCLFIKKSAKCADKKGKVVVVAQPTLKELSKGDRKKCMETVNRRQRYGHLLVLSHQSTCSFYKSKLPYYDIWCKREGIVGSSRGKL